MENKGIHFGETLVFISENGRVILTCLAKTLLREKCQVRKEYILFLWLK